MRWKLAKLNGRWGWFPWGTWAANIGACLIDFICQVIICDGNL
jgi:fluoride ion exporter CrcB/FEX